MRSLPRSNCNLSVRSKTARLCRGGFQGWSQHSAILEVVLSSSRRIKKGPGRRPLSAKRRRFTELREREQGKCAGHKIKTAAGLSACEEQVNDPVGAALLVRAMAFRADLAGASGDSVTARRWGRAVAGLWSSSDPFLAPVVERMHRASRGKTQ